MREVSKTGDDSIFASRPFECFVEKRSHEFAAAAAAAAEWLIDY